jgi:hypothetical protein
MSRQIEGSFGDKLKQVVEGREFPRASAASESVDGKPSKSRSAGGSGKDGRRRRETRDKEDDEKREGTVGRSAPVPSHQVHHRGGQVETEIPRSRPKAEQNNSEGTIKLEAISQESLRTVYADIIESRRGIRLLLKAFDRAKYIPDEEGIPVSVTVEALLKGADDIVRPYAESGDTPDSALREGLDARNKDLIDIQAQLLAYREALKEIARQENLGLEESGSGEAISDSDRKGKEDRNASQGESFEQSSFEERLDVLEIKLSEWEGIRKEILKEGDSERLEKDLEDAAARDLHRRKVLDSVAAEATMYRQDLAEGKMPGKKEQAWLSRHLQGLDEIIAAGKAVRDRIVGERTHENEKREVEERKRDQLREERRQKREGAVAPKSETVRADAENQPDEEAQFGAKLASVKEFLHRWNTLGGEFGYARLKKAIRKAHKGYSIPQTGALEDWLAERTTPAAWQGGVGKENKSVVLKRAFPEMEALVQNAEAAVVVLREQKERRVVQSKTAPVAVSADGASEAAPAENVVTINRRRVEKGELTEWEQKSVGEQGVIKEKTLGLKQTFVSGLDLRLAQRGIQSQSERRKAIDMVLGEYLRDTLGKKEVIGVSLTKSEIDALVIELTKDVTSS